MKKILSIVLIIALLGMGLFILTGCESGDSSGVTLKYEYDGKSHQANFKLSSNDKITEFKEDNPESARIENEKENYVLDLYIEGVSSDAYAKDKKMAEENNSEYAESKFGKYDGYTQDDSGDIQGYILLDSKDSNSNIRIVFNLYLNDNKAQNTDIESIFKSSSVQNILNNIDYKTK